MKAVARALVVLAVLAAWPDAGRAAAPLALSATKSASPAAELHAAPADLQPSEVEAFVAPLTDAEARAMLLAELRVRTAGVAAAEQKRSMFASMLDQRRHATAMLDDRLVTLRQAFARLPETLDAMHKRLTVETSSSRGLVALAIMMGAGLAAAFVVLRLTAPISREWMRRSGATWPVRATLLGGRLLLDLAGVVVFVLVAAAVSSLIFSGNDPMRSWAETCAAVFAVAWGAYMVACFLFAPKAPGLRLITLDNRAARRAMRLMIVMAGWLALMEFSRGLMELLGADPATITLTELALMALLILAFAFHLLTAHVDPAEPPLLRAWPWIGLVVLAVSGAMWLLNGVIGERRAAMSSMVGFILFLSVPVASAALRSVFPSRERMHGARRLLAAGVYRTVLTLLTLASITFLLQGAGLPLYSLLQTATGREVTAGMARIAVTILVAVAGWALLRDWIDRWIAREREIALANADVTGAGEGEGGSGIIGTRAQTLLPLLRASALVSVVSIALLMILSAIGIDIGPLLAGAGVVGIAIGFGAQALVRDVVSGIFFLIDDAFRVGEYLEIDNLRGEVEKISIRSMQLRHHRGMIQTIPFGELRSITNYSRDWVIYKQDFLVPFETDIEKVRKLIKNLGQEMVKNPDYGHLFIEPLKSQGVTRMEEAGMIIRTKFTCKPRQQFLLRRYVNLNIQRLFQENGIEFARRRIQVESQGTEGGQAAAAAAEAAIGQELAPAEASANR
jgi:moderate conductance mechanosensitive channel